MKSAIDWTEVRGRLARAEQGLAASLLPDQARTDALLRRRADALATRRRGVAAKGAPRMVLTAVLGSERYAVELSSLCQVVPLRGLVPVAGADPKVLGVMNLLGEVGTVWDLAALLDLPAAAGPRQGGHVLVLKPGGEIGLRVDHAEGAQEIDLATLTAPQGGEGPLRGSTPDRVQVLDVEALLGRLEP
jgi:chemotaxis signal transduction protein